jgi:hypothetical protein
MKETHIFVIKQATNEPKKRIKTIQNLNNIYTILLCCPCYMPKYIPRLEGIMHRPEG